MAKAAASSPKKSTALAKPETTTLALVNAGSDFLDDILGDVDLGTDGLEEVDNSDINLPVMVFNMKGKDADGRALAPDVYYNTVTEGTHQTVDCVLLTMHKTNEWTEYNDDKGRNVKLCRSADRKTGTMEDGTQRPCEKCPDAQWRTDEKGKRSKHCGTVINVVGVDRETGRPFIVRAKKTSLRPFKNYLNKHFIGARGSKGNVPLFAYQTTMGLTMSDDGKYSLPVYTRGKVLDRASIVEAAETAKFYREIVLPANVEAFGDIEDNAGGGSEPIEVASGKTDPNEFTDEGAEAVGTAAMNF